ncbi:hypothetical protein BDQ17DRAFT_1322260 [Cyathus striatus]|nr:hypothetical protein BDQ17DRAFT_1322260 [Cyathus striatus]
MSGPSSLPLDQQGMITQTAYGEQSEEYTNGGTAPSHEDVSHSQPRIRLPLCSQCVTCPSRRYIKFLPCLIRWQDMPPCPLGVAGDMEGYGAPTYGDDFLQRTQALSIQSASTMAGYTSASFGHYNMEMVPLVLIQFFHLIPEREAKGKRKAEDSDGERPISSSCYATKRVRTENRPGTTFTTPSYEDASDFKPPSSCTAS